MSVTAPTPSLLELLPDTHNRACRLLVELRQNDLVRWNPFAEVGVAFGCSCHTNSSGEHCFFARASFADLGRKAQIFRNEAGQPCSLFELGIVYRGATSKAPYRAYYSGGIPGATLFYRPQNPERTPGRWRQLRIEIKLEKLQATWERQTIALAWAAELPGALARMQGTYPDLMDLHPVLSSRGPIGLFLEGCSVSIRRFVVEPLREED